MIANNKNINQKYKKAVKKKKSEKERNVSIRELAAETSKLFGAILIAPSNVRELIKYWLHRATSNNTNFIFETENILFIMYFTNASIFVTMVISKVTEARYVQFY